jgi:hypothetical protein
MSDPNDKSGKPSAKSALDALRAAAPAAAPAADAKLSALAALRAQGAAAAPAVPDAKASALAALRGAAPSAPATDPLPSALDALRAAGASAAAEVKDDAAAALAALRAAAPVAAEGVADAASTALDALRAAGVSAAAEVKDDAAAALAALRAAAPAAAEGVADAASTALDALRAAGASAAAEVKDDAAAALAALRAAAPVAEPEQDPLADLDALFAVETPTAAPVPAAPAPLDDLEALLAAPAGDPLDALLAGAEAAMAPAAAEPAVEADTLDDLEALLAAPAGDPLDALLAGAEEAMAAVPSAADPLARFAETYAPPPEETARPARRAEPPRAAPQQPLFGTLNAPAPAPENLVRKTFRLVVMGDFSGRAARGELEVGAALAERRAIRLDVDTVEKVIEGFATSLVLPVGPEGKGITVPLTDLDSLHPDQLVENVSVFAELSSLRQRLTTPSMAAKAVAEMQSWAGAFRDQAMPTAGRSAAAAVPADVKLTDFQRLIDDREGRLARPSPAADLIARIVGPHVRPGLSAEAKALRPVVDQAMASAMTLILHHPEFQAVEAHWRAIDMLARRIETDERFEIVLFDISAEEFAADLALQAEISGSGLFRLLNRPLTEEGDTGYSAVCALYTFEETPPHADLLGRAAKLAQHLRAPFFAAMSPAYLETPRKDRHPLVAKAWDALRAESAAAWLGLATPRFLMRLPYGERSDPIDAFDFEEFSMSEGLSGMLWGNPVLLVAVLLGRAWAEGKGRITLGKVMTLGEMPFHYATDRHGDQVPLPCTERNLTTDRTEMTVTRGFMPVISVRGRDVVRLGSFQSMAGAEILGPWSDAGAGAATPGGPAPTLQAVIPAAPPAADAASLDADLDALLAGFADTPAAPADPAAIDADLAALLEGL